MLKLKKTILPLITAPPNCSNSLKLLTSITAALMPFTYAQIGFAALMSGIFFSHAPDFWAWTGMAMIAASGGATAWLNIRQKK